MRIILLMTLTFSTVNILKIKYLNGLNENEDCELNANVYGVCRKISDCLHEFESYRRDQSVLKICRYKKIPEDTLICCDKNQGNPEDSYSHDLRRINSSPQSLENPDLFDFETCRQEFLKYRESTINPDFFGKAMEDGIIPNNSKNIEYLNELNKIENPENLRHFRPHFNVLYGKKIKKGNRPNMAAIGWTRENNTVKYACGGSLVTERFIVTAAHCKYLNGTQADTVRLGDRYLYNEQDDDIAQQHKIARFILHPNYTSKFFYNDIAMIETVTKILFSSNIVPACILNADTDLENHKYISMLTVAGYGETEQRIASNILLEINAGIIAHEKCNETFEYHNSLPNGIQPSQYCVKSFPIKNDIYPDTCFGDSGSPLQTNIFDEVFHKDFNTTYLTTIYSTPAVVGVVSFGSDCGFKVPSVYTRLDYFKDWMRDVIKNY